MINYKHFRGLSTPLLALLPVAFWLCSIHSAVAADADTLGAMFCNAFLNTKPFGKMATYISYAAGIGFALQGVHHFHQHTENKQNHPMHRPVLLWAGAAGLIALPKFIGAIENSIYTPAGGGLGSCTPGAVAGGQSLDLMLAGFVGNIRGPLTTWVSAIAIVTGCWMIVQGLMKASKHGFDPKTNSINSIGANFLFGALLMTIGDNVNMILGSTFGAGTKVTLTTASTVTGWGFVSALGGGSAQFANAIAAALTFFSIVGTIAFVRGWLILKKVVEGGGNVTMGQGITHVAGGVLAINIGPFLKIMDTTFGTNLM